jgi:hypothetical protein
MAQDLKKNEILKKMWLLDEKVLSGQVLTIDEVFFYNTNLKIIQDYYNKNNLYWQGKIRL